MTERDRKRLAGCHALLIAAVEKVIDEMATQGHPMMVTNGARTVSEQMILWRKGRDLTGRIVAPRSVVTYCDGIVKKSNHQSGRAADCAFLVDGMPSWDESLPWKLYGQAAERHGLAWGGRWDPPKQDKPHIELPSTVGRTA